MWNNFSVISLLINSKICLHIWHVHFLMQFIDKQLCAIWIHANILSVNTEKQAMHRNKRELTHAWNASDLKEYFRCHVLTEMCMSEKNQLFVMPFEWVKLKLQQFHMFVYYFYVEYFSKNSSKRWIIPHRLFFGLLRKEKWETAKANGA